MKFDEVRACLEKEGWPVELVSEVTLRSRFRSGDRVFPLFVHVEAASMSGPLSSLGEPADPPEGSDPAEAWARRPSPHSAPPHPPDGHPIPSEPPAYATFAVIPFARLPTDESGDLLCDRLLELNREMNLAKFSLDEDGDVILSVEYPLADLDPSEVKDAVDLLSFYTEKFCAEVEAAASPTHP